MAITSIVVNGKVYDQKKINYAPHHSKLCSREVTPALVSNK